MKTKYHRNGEVTFWDVYDQVWRRVAADRIDDAALASLTEAERRRIAKMANA